MLGDQSRGDVAGRREHHSGARAPGVLVADIGHLDHINQFMQLLGDLFNDEVVASGDQRQAGYL